MTVTYLIESKRQRAVEARLRFETALRLEQARHERRLAIGVLLAVGICVAAHLLSVGAS